MKVSKFKSSYLCATDVPEPVTVIVDRVVEEMVGRDAKREKKAVLYYRGGAQGIVLSKTTISQLVEIFKSDESDDWIGKKITMYQDKEVFFDGKQMSGIRFRAATQVGGAD